MTKLFTFLLLMLSLSLKIPPTLPQAFAKTAFPHIEEESLSIGPAKKNPFIIIKNCGQLHIDAQYYINGKGHKVYFNKDKITFTITTFRDKKISPFHAHTKTGRSTYKTTTFSLKPLGSSDKAGLIPGQRLPGKINYLIGKRKSWHTDIPIFKEILYKNLYKGIDLRIYGKRNQMEYDFIVSPHVDPSKIQMLCEGIDTLKTDAKGNLIIKNTPFGDITHLKPTVYQSIKGKRRTVEGSFIVAKNTFSFNIKTYDTNYPLIIDPLTLSYSTYIGGSSEDLGQSIAIDLTGNAYITGITNSEDFLIENPYQPLLSGGYASFVTKIDSAGDTLVYSTYIGGSGNDRARAIAIDSTGSAFITGETSSQDFPTKNPYQSTFRGGDCDAFITRLTPSGNDISFSTYFGGDQYDTGSSLSVDSSGAIYVAGTTRSSDFPVKNALQKNIKKRLSIALADAFVAKLRRDGKSLIYSTYLGGSGQDEANAIAVDQSGSVYIAGETSSVDFPAINALQQTYAGFKDAFVCKLNSTGDKIVYSTYLGGSNSDSSRSITADPSGYAYIAGETVSLNFPVLNAYQHEIGGYNQSLLYFGDAFAAKITPHGENLVYSTYLGGSGQDRANSIAVDSLGNAYIAGETSSVDFPAINALQGALKGKNDAFLSMLNPEGKKLVCSTYLGGASQDIGMTIVVGFYGFPYLAGLTYSDDFPLKKPLVEKAPGKVDIFITKINLLDKFPLPDGDVAPFGKRDGVVDVGDALVCLQFALGLKTPSQEDLLHADISPLNIYGNPQPDGRITVGDSLLILRKAIGVISF